MSDGHEWYFAYGSNMDAERLRLRNVGVIERRAATLVGWRLVFDKRSRKNPSHTAANIHPDRNAVVEGALCLVEVEGLAILDRLEGAPIHYRRSRIDVALASGTRGSVRAWTYVATPEWRTEPAAPPDGYLRHLLAGADVLSEGYRRSLERLSATPEHWEGRNALAPSQARSRDLGSEL